MLLLRPALTSCLALLLILGATACDSEDGTTSGEMIPARTDTQLKDGARSHLLVPTGKLQLATGEAVASLEADQTRDGASYDAPDGASYLPVAWRFRAGRFARVEDYLNTRELPVVDLVAGDDNYRLPPPPRGGGWRSFYVQVESGAEAPTLRVAFDGVTQSVSLRNGKREPGGARRLYDLPKRLTTTSDCHDQAFFDMARASAKYTCEVTRTTLLPYADGGWAPKGSQWLAIELRDVLTRLAQASPDGGGGAWYFADGVRTTLRAGKVKPTSMRGLDNAADTCPDARENYVCGSAAIATFEIAGKLPRKLAVEHRYHLVRAKAYGGYSPKEQRKVRSSTSLDLGD